MEFVPSAMAGAGTMPKRRRSYAENLELTLKLISGEHLCVVKADRGVSPCTILRLQKIFKGWLVLGCPQ